MITAVYFLLLLIVSAEDYRRHTVSGHWVLAVWILGTINMVFHKENRWVTVTLTCICFLLLWVIYVLVSRLAEQRQIAWAFGGADVRLIPAMMLVQGWDVALTGIFSGLCLAVLYYVTVGRKKRDIPLVPWMAAGCFLVEIIYLFSGKSVL